MCKNSNTQQGSYMDVIITTTEDEPFQPINTIAGPNVSRPQDHNTGKLRN